MPRLSWPGTGVRERGSVHPARTHTRTDTHIGRCGRDMPLSTFACLNENNAQRSKEYPEEAAVVRMKDDEKTSVLNYREMQIL